jgi:hypothetical protein
LIGFSKFKVMGVVEKNSVSGGQRSAGKIQEEMGGEIRAS